MVDNLTVDMIALNVYRVFLFFSLSSLSTVTFQIALLK